MTRFQVNGALTLIMLAALSAWSGAASADSATDGMTPYSGDLSQLDELVAQAVSRHPEVVAAKAKVESAEAELRSKQIDAARQVFALSEKIKQADAMVEKEKSNVELAKDQLDSMSKQDAALKPDSPEATELKGRMMQLRGVTRTAQASLVQVMGAREQAEKELRYLIGEGARHGSSARPSRGEQRSNPQGPIVEKIRTALGKNINLQLQDVPLSDVTEHLSEKVGIRFVIQIAVLEGSGLDGRSLPTTVRTGDVPLRAALEALEDLLPGELQFVVRDYGILLTTKDEAAKRGYVPAVSFDLQY